MGVALHAASKTLALTHSFQRVRQRRYRRQTAPMRPLALTKPPRFPTSLKCYEPGHSLFSLVLRIRELGSQRSPSPSEWVQNPISVTPSCHGRFGPAAATGHWACAQHSSYRRYQLAVVPPLISPTRANGQEAGAASPTAPHHQHPSVCGARKGLGDKAGEQGSRGAVERSHVLLPPPITPAQCHIPKL